MKEALSNSFHSYSDQKNVEKRYQNHEIEWKQIRHFKKAQRLSKIKSGSDLSPETHQELRTKEKLP